jgi:hypothetical protein
VVRGIEANATTLERLAADLLTRELIFLLEPEKKEWSHG